MRMSGSSSFPKHLVATVIAVSLAVPMTGQTAQIKAGSANGQTAEMKAGSATTKVRIDNFGRIDANYYRGAQPKGHDYQDLAALGVKTVISLTDGDQQPGEREMVEQAGMKFVHIPMKTQAAPAPEQVRQFLSLVNNAASQPVFVHCVGGKHRTGVMTAVYRMTDDHWSPDQAFKEMKQYKFGFDFLHPELKKFVYRYQPDQPSAGSDPQRATAAR